MYWEPLGAQYIQLLEAVGTQPNRQYTYFVLRVLFPTGPPQKCKEEPKNWDGKSYPFIGDKFHINL